MNKMTESSKAGGTGPLTFKRGTHVTQAQLEAYAATVDRLASEVCDGIAVQLRKEKLAVRVEKQPNAKWTIAVGAAGGREFAGAQDVTANITVTATGADIPPIINALGAFFSNWRAVGGLIAVGAAYVAGSYVLSVNQAPQQ